MKLLTFFYQTIAAKFSCGRLHDKSVCAVFETNFCQKLTQKMRVTTHSTFS